MTFTHIDEHGKARMVDVNPKPVSRRQAMARARVRCELPDDEVIEAARFAGLAAAQRTAFLIPLCHQIPIDGVRVSMGDEQGEVVVEAEITTEWRTGVEMEALSAVSIAALTLVAASKVSGARIDDIAIWSKSGGQSGEWGRVHT